MVGSSLSMAGDIIGVGYFNWGLCILVLVLFGKMVAT